MRQTLAAGASEAAPAGHGQGGQATASSAQPGQAARVVTAPVARSTRRTAKLP